MISFYQKPIATTYDMNPYAALHRLIQVFTCDKQKERAKRNLSFRLFNIKGLCLLFFSSADYCARTADDTAYHCQITTCCKSCGCACDSK